MLWHFQVVDTIEEREERVASELLLKLGLRVTAHHLRRILLSFSRLEARVNFQTIMAFSGA